MCKANETDQTNGTNLFKAGLLMAVFLLTAFAAAALLADWALAAGAQIDLIMPDQ